MGRGRSGHKVALRRAGFVPYLPRPEQCVEGKACDCPPHPGLPGRCKSGRCPGYIEGAGAMLCGLTL